MCIWIIATIFLQIFLYILHEFDKFLFYKYFQIKEVIPGEEINANLMPDGALFNHKLNPGNHCIFGRLSLRPTPPLPPSHIHTLESNEKEQQHSRMQGK